MHTAGGPEKHPPESGVRTDEDGAENRDPRDSRHFFIYHFHHFLGLSSGGPDFLSYQATVAIQDCEMDFPPYKLDRDLTTAP